MTSDVFSKLLAALSTSLTDYMYAEFIAPCFEHALFSLPIYPRYPHARQYHVELCAKHPHIEIHAATRHQAAYLLQHSVTILLRRAIGRA